MTEPTHMDDNGKFRKELPRLFDEIEEILQQGGSGSHKIDDVLEHLTSYNGLDRVKQCIVQDFKNALKTLGSLPVEYLTDVVCDSESAPDRDTFALIYKGKWKEEQIRVKKFHRVEPPNYIKGHYEEEFIQHVKPFASFCRELDQWKMVSNFDYVWPLLGFTMWLDRQKAAIVYALVSPLAEGHLKLDYMDWESLTPEKFTNYFHDAAMGLQNLHDHCVIHGNIHCENILQNKGHCFLVGFDMSESVDSSHSSSFSFAPVIAKAQQIPELIDGSVTQLDQNTDIFSFGSTMYQILAWTTPTTLIWDIGHPERPDEHVGQEWDAIWNLILRCLSKDRTNRPTAPELVKSLQAF